ncbi:MAG: glycosyltransferase family 4 protein [Gemmataceae bacterium]|nr:glycosyltransferase family 4 protein [Gemmataceae bacterium]
MRVALLSHNAQTGDAIGNQVAEKLSFFLDRQADVRVLVESDRDLHPAVRPHAQVVRRGDQLGDHWTFLADADLVVVEYGQAYSLLDLLPLLAGGKPRLLIDYHGITPPELWGLQNREALEKGVRHRGLAWCADAVLVHSLYTQRELHEQCGLPRPSLRRLGFPLDLDRFGPGPSTYWRESLGLENARVLLFVGRLAPNKRVPLLIDALARLRDLDPAVHLLIAGPTNDLYRVEARRCQAHAEELNVTDRVHFLGHLTGERLVDAYRAADVFVTASLWESFCIPVVEAMACGVPVVAARAAALPETVASAGLTFRPDDLDDLERQLRRALDCGLRNAECGLTEKLQSAIHNPQSAMPRVAVVSFRYGTDFAGGAETSLRTIAGALQGAGCHVEVFTTCARHESEWTNALPEGTTEVEGVCVHRFPIDAHDRPRHLESFRTILQAEGRVSPETEEEYLRHSIHSSPLMEALTQRADQFDAILTGPYLYGLTSAVARGLPEKTLVLPCFHDEPLARLRAWPDVYGVAGGLLYHSAEEQHLAEAELGINNPGAVCIGTWLDTEAAGDAAAGRRLVGTTAPYVVYLGRHSPQKDLPALFEHARRYHAERPGRFTFVFLGQGPVPIPAEPWARDLGFVDEQTKRNVLAGAAALVQPCAHESLSLAALEAWAQATPVLANARCPVLVGHLRRCGGGQAVDGYEELARALNDLWEQPAPWHERGRQGREYVRAHYGSRAALAARVLEAVQGLQVPLAEHMRQRGRERAAAFARASWRERFAEVVEQVLDAGPRPYREQVEVRPRRDRHTVSAGARAVLVPVRVVNRGTHPLVPEGPARTVLSCRVWDEQGREKATAEAVPLPGLLMPGRALAAAVSVPVPADPGVYRVAFWAERVYSTVRQTEAPPTEDCLRLVVEGQGRGGSERGVALEAVQAALAEASRLQRLPDDYTDVTEGPLAALKRKLKRKLLGNFKHAYVDVLSRQQSACNARLLEAIQELTECCATLDHAVQILLQRVAELEGQGATAQDQASGGSPASWLPPQEAHS